MRAGCGSTQAREGAGAGAEVAIAKKTVEKCVPLDCRGREDLHVSVEHRWEVAQRREEEEEGTIGETIRLRNAVPAEEEESLCVR